MAEPWFRRRRLQVAVVVVALAAGAAAIVATVIIRSGDRPSAAPVAQEAPGSQHIDYVIKSSLLELVKSSDLIGECTVLSVSAPFEATPRVDGSPPSGLPAPGSATEQRYELRVDRALRSNGPAPATITIEEKGSRGQRGAAQSDPPLVVGSRYLLFLHRAASGTYGFVGGPEGRLLIDASNRLQPVLSGDQATAILRNRSLDQLAAILRGFLPATPTR